MLPFPLHTDRKPELTDKNVPIGKTNFLFGTRPVEALNDASSDKCLLPTKLVNACRCCRIEFTKLFNRAYRRSGGES